MLTIMNKNNLKPGEVTELILETIADYLIDMGGYFKPSLNVLVGLIIKEILKKRKIEKKKIERSLKILEKREIIILEEKDDKVFIQLHKNGKSKIIKYSIKLLLDFKKKEKKWKGKWYIVFFDVPEIQRNKRDYLRRFLLKLGFYPYQKSVYLFPYECEEEINLIKTVVEGAKYMKYTIAEKIEDENLAKIFFKLH